MQNIDFTQPFYVWEDETGTLWCLDGKHRTILLEELILEGKEVTFHTSRNSFADYAKKKGIDIHTLKDLFGHTKVASTEKYMKAFYEEETDQALENMFG